MLLLVDNFDSFTYNLVDYFNQLGEECEVVRNDVHPESLDKEKYSALVLSPGSGKAENAGFLMEYIKSFENLAPILGICLGHQAIANYYGAKVVKAVNPMHGKISSIHQLTDDALFEGIHYQYKVVRYHSLVVNNLENTFLVPLACSEEKENMILKHQFFPIYGIQYHPEAALTEYGLKILANWKSLLNRKKEAIVDKL